MNEEDVKEETLKLIAQVRSIHERCEAEDRMMTAEERDENYALWAQIDELQEVRKELIQSRPRLDTRKAS